MCDAVRVCREIKLLRHLCHPNCINLLDLSAPLVFGEFNVIYMMTEHYPTDLARIIRSTQPITDAHVQTLMYQLMCGLKYLHSANILHRELKPTSVLVNRECGLCICDFGLALVSYELEDMDPEPHIVVRWYRAPELIMLAEEYSYQVRCYSMCT